jgi:hypothetical protein
MRGKAYRRAQQARMVNRALQARVFVGLRSTFELMPRETKEERYLRAKKWANNLAKCSCEMCTGHKRGPFAQPTTAELKQHVSTHQQMEELQYDTYAY